MRQGSGYYNALLKTREREGAKGRSYTKKSYETASSSRDFAPSFLRVLFLSQAQPFKSRKPGSLRAFCMFIEIL